MPLKGAYMKEGDTEQGNLATFWRLPYLTYPHDCIAERQEWSLYRHRQLTCRSDNLADCRKDCWIWCQHFRQWCWVTRFIQWRKIQIRTVRSNRVPTSRCRGWGRRWCVSCECWLRKFVRRMGHRRVRTVWRLGLRRIPMRSVYTLYFVQGVTDNGMESPENDKSHRKHENQRSSSKLAPNKDLKWKPEFDRRLSKMQTRCEGRVNGGRSQLSARSPIGFTSQVQNSPLRAKGSPKAIDIHVKLNSSCPSSSLNLFYMYTLRSLSARDE